MATTLKDVLDRLAVEGDLYERLPERRVRCYACGHRCLIPEGRDGVCKVRFNRDGTLFVPSGYVATALQLDPVEKKPFFHALPGAAALSFGMLGCDYHCGYCQNWLTSQVLRDADALARPSRVSPEEIVRCAVEQHAPIITSTYNEPLITSEWAVAVFKLAKARGLKTAYVSNGNATPEVLAYLKPWLDLYKVDLKGFDDAHYRKLGGKLQTVLDTIRIARRGRILGRGGDPGGAGLERYRGGAPGDRPVPGGREPGHPMARDRVSSGLPDGGSAVDAGRDAHARGSDRAVRGAPLRLCGQRARTNGVAGKHLLPDLRDPADRTGRVPGARQSPGGRGLPPLPDPDSGGLVLRACPASLPGVERRRAR